MTRMGLAEAGAIQIYQGDCRVAGAGKHRLHRRTFEALGRQVNAGRDDCSERRDGSFLAGS